MIKVKPCVKCGSDDFTLEYRRSNKEIFGPYGEVIDAKPERLIVTCSTCKAYRAISPLDAK